MVVAINQVRLLMTDVGKGSMRTVIDHGLGGPKGLARARNSDSSGLERETG